MTESDFQEWLKELAEATGWLYYHVPDSRRCPAGFPDTVLVKGRQLIFGELKVHGRKPTNEQLDWLTKLSRVTGVLCYIWRPKDRDEIEKLLMGE